MLTIQIIKIPILLILLNNNILLNIIFKLWYIIKIHNKLQELIQIHKSLFPIYKLMNN
jgi:hypothetical protein